MPVNPFLGALDLGRAYGSRETTATEVVDGLLARIETHDPRLGAFQFVYADDARLAAEAADAAMRSGHHIGPFHGVPFAVKDVIDVEVRITTGGSLTTSGDPATCSATVARRLLAAGGILIGKTKTIEFSMGGWGTNQHMGTPRNPWDHKTHRAPGGSSSGSAVAVAAGLVPCAIGTDTGGSIRTPSAWCGVVGLKVTHGLLPMDAIIPTAHSLDTPGPIVRSVADAAFVFDVMAGQKRQFGTDPLDSGSPDHSLLSLRLGKLPESEREGMETSILDLYDAAVDRLRSLGAEVDVFEPPMSYTDLALANRLIATAEAYTHHGALMENVEARVDEDVRQLILPGRDISARDYVAATLQRKADIATFLDRL